MTENELITQKFYKINISKEESGDKSDYHYYVYELSENLSLISCASDKVINYQWSVYLESEEYPIRDIADVIVLKEMFNKWKSQSTTPFQR